MGCICENRRSFVKGQFIKRLILALFLSGVFNLLHSQDTPVPNVRIAALVKPGQIKLRWGVDEASAWRVTNKYGFKVEKYLLKKNGQLVESPQLLWTKTFVAEPVENWKDAVNNDDYAAIIAQALYGKSFAVDGVNGGKLAEIVNLAEENNQRFSVSLLAADMNFSAAVKAGWGYEDNEVNSDETYVYKIISPVPEEELQIKAGAVVVNAGEATELPAPIDVQGIFEDMKTTLVWDYEYLKNTYTSYVVERSDDGQRFMPINDKPLINLNESEDNAQTMMYFVDSLAQNDKTYYYRVKGISPFGESGAYSDMISGSGTKELKYTPNIINFEFTRNQNEAIIQWEFPKEGEPELKEFQLISAELDQGPYSTIVEGIGPEKRQLTYSNLKPSNYVKIRAVGKDGKTERTSFSTFIQPIDSIPPVRPSGLKGSIDTLGLVRLSWNANTEIDLAGYKIYRTFYKDDEPSALQAEPITSNAYVDTVQIMNLNAKVYYKIIALDRRFNHSDYSEVLELEKPDLVPPASPVFNSFKVEDGKVYLSWYNSTDPEATQMIYRQDLTGNSTPELIYQSTDKESYTDESAQIDKKYRYSIVAKDKAGLISEPSPVMTIRVIDTRPDEIIKSVKEKINRKNRTIELSWNTESREVAEYTIYKQTGDAPITTFRTVPAKITQVTDEDVLEGTHYNYQIRATMKDGNYSEIKTINVKF